MNSQANTRVDYLGACVDQRGPPAKVCNAVVQSGRCFFSAENCRMRVQPEEGCCPICGTWAQSVVCGPNVSYGGQICDMYVGPICSTWPNLWYVGPIYRMWENLWYVGPIRGTWAQSAPGQSNVHPCSNLWPSSYRIAGYFRGCKFREKPVMSLRSNFCGSSFRGDSITR